MKDAVALTGLDNKHLDVWKTENTLCPPTQFLEVFAQEVSTPVGCCGQIYPPGAARP
jgi:hypothetical protein